MDSKGRKEESKSRWRRWKTKHPAMVQLFVFYMISNLMTLLELVMMPFIKYIFSFTSLVEMNFQMLPAGHNGDGSIYYVFDYASGSIGAGGGGGMAYFLAVEITLFTAQIINFFLQRNVTFKSSVGIAKAAAWYFTAWVIISVGAAALQGIYKTPLYDVFMKHMGSGIGMTAADIVTMLINCIISFWVFFPILKIIFKETREK